MILKKYEDFNFYKRNIETFDKEIYKKVEKIIEDVKSNGDDAIYRYSQQFDGVKIKKYNLRVSEEEIEKSLKETEKNQKEILNLFLEAAKNIEEFHSKQKVEGYSFTKDNAIMGMKIAPLEKVLTYVPGGKAFYPSTAIMNIIPAKVARVKEIIMTTPPSEDGGVKNHLAIALAHKLNVSKIYKVGGAQAIAGFTFGTETLPNVSKIVGPGNIYVATAKRIVSGTVGIDSIAGPSEVITFADETANPDWVAIDLCAQAEHTGDNTVILISTSLEFIKKVETSLEKIIKKLSRSDLIKKSLQSFAMAVLVENYEQGFEIINKIAPEHVEVMINLDNSIIIEKIYNAGAIFIGDYTPVALGDYFAGPNHVIPTNGTAIFSSPLGVYDFIKRSSFLLASKEYIDIHAEKILKLSNSEELDAHGLSVTMRKNKKN